MSKQWTKNMNEDVNREEWGWWDEANQQIEGWGVRVEKFHENLNKPKKSLN